MFVFVVERNIIMVSATARHGAARPNRLGWHAGYLFVSSNISGYHSPCSNDCSASDRDAPEDYGSGPNPHVATNPHRRFDKRLFCDRALLFSSVIMVSNVAKWTDKAVGADRDAFRRVKHREAVDVCPASYR
jgi:hypothetical protein